ncbi:XRE family transcriptional regulator [Streptomyces sp. NPDC127098]|uniref:XRE family transcriptional regulator n=1 Tax=Streptomyces sp. NPDC127098 TaxID=3347137 RepID=UPI0036683AB2
MQVDRRTFAAYSGASLIALAHDRATIEPGRLAGALRGRHVDGALLDALEAMTTRFADMGTAQRQHALTTLDALHTTLADLLDHGRCDATALRRIHVMVARVATTIAWWFFDHEGHGVASRYWHSALHSAQEVGDHDLGAGILSDLAYQAVWLGQPATAADILSHATTRAAHPASRSLLHLRRARAHALLGDARACHRDLSAAEAHLAATAPDPTPAWCVWMSPADLMLDTGRCLLDLDRTGDAHHHITAGLAQLTARRAKTTAVFDAYRAESHLRANDIDLAADAAARALTTASDIGASRVVAGIRRLLPVFEPHLSVQGVAELMDLARTRT